MKGNGTRRRAAAVLIAAMMAGAPGALPAQEPEASRMEPIVVTATRIEQRPSEQASAVSVVTRDEIELFRPAVAGDVLQDVPGIIVQRTGSPGNRENIKIRGGAATHTLVMIDGFKVNSPTLGSFDISALPAGDFERVEVVRGAQSALYGSNALSGVVNFIPRKGVEGRQYVLGGSGGSFGTAQGNASAQVGGKKGHAYLGAQAFRSDGILPNDDTDLASFLGSGEVRVSEEHRLHLLLFSTDQDKGVPIDFGSPRDANHRSDRRGVLGGARWEWAPAEAVALELSGSVFREISREEDPADTGETSPFVFDDLTKTRKTDVRLQVKVSPSHVSTTFLGAEYEKDRATDVNRTSFGDTDLASSTFNRSLYVQEELRPSARSGVSLGVRMDRNSEAGTEWNPKAAAYYEWPEIGTRVRAAVGRGFRVPTILEKRDGTIGNPDLSPEVAVSYEGGADFRFPGKPVTAAVTWFYQDIKELIQFDPTFGIGPAGFGELRNVGRAFARGIEAEADYWFVPEAGVALAYTWTDTRDKENDRRILGIPRHRGVASLLLSPSANWQGQIDWRIESDELDPSPNPPPGVVDLHRPGFARVDIYTRYRWVAPNAEIREIALTAKIQNLLDREYEERKGFPAPRINFLLGAEVRI